MFTRTRLVISVAAVLVPAAILVILLLPHAARVDDAGPPSVAPPIARIPPLEGAAAWLNGGPITPDSLRAGPAVIFVWCDTDPISLEMLPRVQGWYEAYGRYGVRVVGIEAPDFSFGADSSVARRLIGRLGVTFPVALDSDYRLRTALGVKEVGPHVLVVDSAGVVLLARGAESMAEVDQAIRLQVRTLHPEIAFPANPAIAPRAAGDGDAPRMVFLGTSHAPTGPLAGATPGRTLNFGAQFRYQVEGEPYVPYPVGRWTPTAEGIVSARGGAGNFVAIRSRADRVAAVIGPPPGGQARVWILADDAWAGPAARDEDVRVDAREATFLLVTEPRLYWIGRGPGRVWKLSPDDPGVTFYSFAFDRGSDAGIADAGRGTH